MAVIWMKKVCSCLAAGEQTESRHCTGAVTDISCFISGLSNGRLQWSRSEAELRLLDRKSFRWLRIEQKTAHQLQTSGELPEGLYRMSGGPGYNQVQKVTHCGCWAHARWKWREAMPDGATVKTSKAAVGFQYCTKLRSPEKKYLYADIKACKDYRQNVARPLLEE